MGAVGERVAVTAVAGVEYLVAAGRAGRGVGHDACADGGGVAGGDAEVRRGGVVGEDGTLDAIDPCQRGALLHQSLAEPVDGAGVRPGPDQYARAVVEDLPRDSELGGDAPDRRAEADALNQAADTDALPGHDVNCPRARWPGPAASRLPACRAGGLILVGPVPGPFWSMECLAIHYRGRFDPSPGGVRP